MSTQWKKIITVIDEDTGKPVASFTNLGRAYKQARWMAESNWEDETGMSVDDDPCGNYQPFISHDDMGDAMLGYVDEDGEDRVVARVYSNVLTGDLS